MLHAVLSSIRTRVAMTCASRGVAADVVIAALSVWTQTFEGRSLIRRAQAEVLKAGQGVV